MAATNNADNPHYVIQACPTAPTPDPALPCHPATRQPGDAFRRLPEARHVVSSSCRHELLVQDLERMPSLRATEGPRVRHVPAETHLETAVVLERA